MPLALLYGAAEALRRRLTKPEKPEIPVICVGNLTAGGAGKTPAVRALADMLQGAGHQPIVLSRGFGGQNAGPFASTRPAMSPPTRAMSRLCWPTT